VFPIHRPAKANPDGRDVPATQQFSEAFGYLLPDALSPVGRYDRKLPAFDNSAARFSQDELKLGASDFYSNNHEPEER
jgi:hypothetical protein